MNEECADCNGTGKQLYRDEAGGWWPSDYPCRTCGGAKKVRREGGVGMNEDEFETLCEVTHDQRDGVRSWAETFPDHKDDWRADVRIVLNALGIQGGAA